MASISAVGFLPKIFPIMSSSVGKSWSPSLQRISGVRSFYEPLTPPNNTNPSISPAEPDDASGILEYKPLIDRRQVLISSLGLLAAAFLNSCKLDEAAIAAEFADMPALRGKDYGKSKMRFPDYTETNSGLQYKDLRVGSGPTPKIGQTVVVDWDGYTIGYYGRIFEARNKTKGGSFEGDDKDFFKFRLGSQEVIPAFEEAVSGMALGGIRRIVVPPELGYPDNDYNKSGPRPTTFSIIIQAYELPADSTNPL